MSSIGSSGQPLRVAIIGAGPAGFYAADHLLKQTEFHIEVDLYDRLPTPYGLVRAGVAPDHQKIKSVTKIFDKVAANPRCHFFGNVELGTDVTVADLRAHYHQIIYTTGAQTDRPLEIPGIDLAGSYAATEFVAWYNGHPDFRECHFDLTQERAAIIGVGNVAIDVARILCRTREELLQTDIAEHALEALSQSQVREIYLIGRRGPAQAAFTTPEVKEVGELAGADVVVPPAEAELDALSRASLAAGTDRATNRKVELIQEYSRRPLTGKPRRLHLRFLLSPTELLDDGSGRVTGIRLVRNRLYATDAGSLRPKPIDEVEELPMGLVFRSIGYLGVPLADVPFNHAWGVILNEGGRVLAPESQEPVVGEYTAGWIKRGPTGVIGTNKPDAVETVNFMLEDLAAGQLLNPSQPTLAAVQALIARRRPDYFSYEDWLALNQLESARGAAVGRPRIKFTSIAEMKQAIGKS